MRDGRTKRAFALRPFYIDVNPLMITCTVGELIDALLVNGEPVGDSKFLSHKLLERADIVSLAAHMYPPVCSAKQNALKPVMEGSPCRSVKASCARASIVDER